MECKLRRFLPGIQVHWSLNGTLWASRNYDIIASSDSGQTWTRITTIPTRLANRFLVWMGPFRRLFRLGIRSYLQLSDCEFIVFCNRKIFLWRQGNGQLVPIGSVRRGSGPLLQGCCSDDKGDCYYGEYWRNPEREEVNVYRWRRGASNWRLYYSFPDGTTRHIHAVQFDSFSRNVWIATGDHDNESRIGYFEPTSFSDPKLVIIAAGKQMARAVSMLFTRDYVYWGSDGDGGAAAKANYIYRWCRRTHDIQQVAKVAGPVYYSTVDQEGRLFVSTAVEGNTSERDRFARIWTSIDGLTWSEFGRWKKDRYPLIFGYGVLSFSGGLTSAAELYVVGNGVRGCPGTWVLASAESA